MAKPPRKPVDQVDQPFDDGEDTQIFDSNKYPVLDRGASGSGRRSPLPPTPRDVVVAVPPIAGDDDSEHGAQATRIVTMEVPAEAVPSRASEKPSTPHIVRRKPATDAPQSGGVVTASPIAPTTPRGQSAVAPRPSAAAPKVSAAPTTAAGARPSSTSMAPGLVGVGAPPTGPRPSAVGNALPGRPAVRPSPSPSQPPKPARAAAPPVSAASSSANGFAAQNTIVAEIDASATAPNLKLPRDLRGALDSNPDMRASFDSNSDLHAIEAGPTNIVDRRMVADLLTPPPEAEATNPRATPIDRHTAPMPIPDTTKIGVIDRSPYERPNQPRVSPVLPAATTIGTPGSAIPPTAPDGLARMAKPGPGEPATAEEAAARLLPRRLERFTPTSMVAIDDPRAPLDAARARHVPDRVRLVTPTAMHAEPAPSDGAAISSELMAHGDDDDDDHDDFHETRERPIDREMLRNLPPAAQAVAFGAAVLDPPSVLGGEAQQMQSPVARPSSPTVPQQGSPSVARPQAPRGGLVWLWMVLAVLAIAAAVATAMWFLAG